MNTAGTFFRLTTVCLNVLFLPWSGGSSSIKVLLLSTAGHARRLNRRKLVALKHQQLVQRNPLPPEDHYSEERVELADWFQNLKLERYFHVFVAKDVPTFCLKSTGSYFSEAPSVWWKIRLGAGNTRLLLPLQASQQHAECYSSTLHEPLTAADKCFSRVHHRSVSAVATERGEGSDRPTQEPAFRIFCICSTSSIICIWNWILKLFGQTYWSVWVMTRFRLNMFVWSHFKLVSIFNTEWMLLKQQHQDHKVHTMNRHQEKGRKPVSIFTT